MGEELGIWWETVQISAIHCEDFEKHWMYFLLLRRIHLPPNTTENFVVKILGSEEIMCPTEGFIKSPFARLLPKHHEGFAFAHLSPATQTLGSSARWHLPVLRQPLNLPTHTCQQGGAVAAAPSSSERMLGVAIRHNFVLVRHTLRTLYLTVRSHVFQMVP